MRRCHCASVLNLKKAPAAQEERLQRELRHLARRLAAPGTDSVLSVSVLDRGRVFQATSEPKEIDAWTVPDAVPRVFTTQVCGKLGQMHDARLERALLRRTAEQDEADGGKTLAVPMGAILADRSAVRTCSCAALGRLLDDLTATRIRLTNFGRTWGTCYGGLRPGI